MLFLLWILPVTAHSAHAAAPTGQQDGPAGRWLPQAHLLHNLSAPGPPALQSSPSCSHRRPCPYNPRKSSTPGLYSHRWQPGGQPATLWDSAQDSTPEEQNPCPGSILRLPSLCLSFFLCRMGMMPISQEDCYEKPETRSGKTFLLFRSSSHQNEVPRPPCCHLTSF